MKLTLSLTLTEKFEQQMATLFSETFMEKQMWKKKVWLIGYQNVCPLPKDMNPSTLLVVMKLACSSMCSPVQLCVLKMKYVLRANF